MTMARVVSNNGSILNVNQLIKALLFMENSTTLCQKIEPLKGGISAFVKENSLLKNEYTTFGILCLISASLCPILLASNVPKLAIPSRVITKIFHQMLPMILIYVNVIILFKNVLVYVLRDNVTLLGKHKFAYNKVIAMMVGELTYEENFGNNNGVQQWLFFFMVFSLTVLLNNLLIGLTTQNVNELMEKSKKALTRHMLKQILDSYGENRKHKIPGFSIHVGRENGDKDNDNGTNWQTNW